VKRPARPCLHRRLGRQYVEVQPGLVPGSLEHKFFALHKRLAKPRHYPTMNTPKAHHDNLSFAPLILIGTLFGVPTAGQCLAEAQHTKQQLGTHRHGSGRLNIAMEGREVYLELDSPIADVAGFEHAPSSDAERASLGAAVAILKDGDRLFRFSPAADCRLYTAHVNSPLTAPDPAMAGHKAQHDGTTKPGAAADRPAENAHADIRVDYQFVCKQPARLERLNVDLFAAFPAIEHIEVQFIKEGRQGAAELTAANRVLRF
jgi:hypothetical protein